MVLAARISHEELLRMVLPWKETKLLVAGIGLANDDQALLELDEGVVEMVEQFKYLGSLVETSGGEVGKVSGRIS